MEIKSFGSICSGVGMQEMAYKRVFNDNIKYFSEIEKFAIKSYGAIHGDIKNLGDFTQARDIDKVDFMFASTPCQDFSVVGKREGFEGMKGTLTYDWVQMIKRLEHKKPNVICFENVKNLVGKKFKLGYELFKEEIEKLGYKTKDKVLNAKDYGVPQNRERIFLVGFLEKTNFEFPIPKPLERKFTDIAKEGLEIPKHILNSFNNKGGDFGKRFRTQGYKDYGMCLTTKNNWAVITNNFFTKDFKSYTISEIVENNIPCFALNPSEYWDMMGIDKEDFEKVKDINSAAQLCKQAGNGIVVDVLEAIFQEIKKCEVIEEKIPYDITKTGEKQYKLFG